MEMYCKFVDVKLHTSSGSTPVKPLFRMDSLCNKFQLPNDVGIVPDKLLPPRNTCLRCVMSPHSGGMLPPSSFPSKPRVLRCSSRRKSTGRFPVKEFLPRPKTSVGGNYRGGGSNQQRGELCTR